VDSAATLGHTGFAASSGCADFVGYTACSLVVAPAAAVGTDTARPALVCRDLGLAPHRATPDLEVLVSWVGDRMAILGLAVLACLAVARTWLLDLEVQAEEDVGNRQLGHATQPCSELADTSGLDPAIRPLGEGEDTVIVVQEVPRCMA
jgi:hypothetical protein